MRLSHLLAVVFLSLTLCVLVADVAEPTAIPPGERAAWATIAGRFAETPSEKSASAKSLELAVAKLKSDPKGGGSASITIDKTYNRVVAVTSNGARFTDDEFK